MNYFLLILSLTFIKVNVLSMEIDTSKSELNFIFYYIEDKHFDDNSIEMINNVMNDVSEDGKKALMAFNGSKLVLFNNEKEEVNTITYLLDSIKTYSNYYSFDNEKEIIYKTELLNNITEVFEKYIFSSKILEEKIKLNCHIHFLVDSDNLNLLLNDDSNILDLFNNISLISLIDNDDLKLSIYSQLPEWLESEGQINCEVSLMTFGLIYE